MVWRTSGCFQERQNPVGSRFGYAGASSVHQYLCSRRCPEKEAVSLTHVQHGNLKSIRKTRQQEHIHQNQHSGASQPFSADMSLRPPFFLFPLLFSSRVLFRYTSFPLFSYPESPQQEYPKAQIIQKQLPILRLSTVNHRARKT